MHKHQHFGRFARYLLLGGSVLFSLGLVVFVTLYTGQPYLQVHYRYLVWNLFLAALPFALSSLLVSYGKRLSGVSILVLTGLWLLFFPNAPYILTDLFHLEDQRTLPSWYDLLVILSFAWNGLVLGFVSLRDVQLVLSERLGRGFGWVFAAFALGLGSFGIYIGRYLRWNSWDVIVNPQHLFYDIAPRVLSPLEHPGTWGMTLAFSVFLGFCYLTFLGFSRLEASKGAR